MKKLLILLFLLSAIAATAEAQDLIILKNGTEVEAKVLEVNLNDVRFQKFANPDGPVYTESKRNIVMIRYANGEKDIFSSYNPYATYAPSPYSMMRRVPEDVRPGMRYSEYVSKYDTRYYDRYEPERYSPYLAGVCSYLVPGLGQVVCGEWMRGICVFSGVCATLVCTGTFEEYSSEAAIMFGCAAFGLWIWNVCDAVKVAKVKNMYLNDTAAMQSSLSVSASPFLSFVPSGAGGAKAPAAGLSFHLNF